MDEVMRLSLRAVHKRRASQDVVKQVQDLLISGRLRPGYRLPSERDLADTLQVGRSTIREAYRSLEALGVIRVQPGAAAYVAELATHATPTVMAEPSQFRTWEQQRQLFEVRLVLDPPIAALAARRATGDHLARLRALVRPQEGNGGGQGIEADIEFHALVFEASGNPILRDFAVQVAALLRESWKRIATPDRPIASFAQHRLILHAIEGRDPEAAERHMRAHLHTIAELVLALPQ